MADLSRLLKMQEGRRFVTMHRGMGLFRNLPRLVDWPATMRAPARAANLWMHYEEGVKKHSSQHVTIIIVLSSLAIFKQIVERLCRESGQDFCHSCANIVRTRSVLGTGLLLARRLIRDGAGQNRQLIQASSGGLAYFHEATFPPSLLHPAFYSLSTFTYRGGDS